MATLGAQTISGPPERAQVTPIEQAQPVISPLMNFSWSVIGQEPSLLKRLSSVDQEQELQYPSSPVTPSPARDNLVFGAASSGSALTGSSVIATTTSSGNTTTSRTGAVAPVSSTQLHAQSMSSDAGPTVSTLTSSQSASVTDLGAQHPGFPSNGHAHSSLIPSVAASKNTAPSIIAGPSHTSPLSTPTVALGSPSLTPSQELRLMPAMQASPSALIARVSQVALEQAEWNEMKALMEKYRQEHAALLLRNEDATRASQREREQALKVSSVVETAFAKLDALRLRHEERLAADQLAAERALADAQSRAVEQPAQEKTASGIAGLERLAEVKRATVAREKRRAGLDHDAQAERPSVQQDKVQVRPEAAEEARQAEEEERSGGAAKHKAEQEEKLRIEQEERRTADAVAQTRMEEQRRRDLETSVQEEEERQRDYAARRAEVLEKKQANLEKQRLEAAQQQGKRASVQAELKARLEKEKREAPSRPASSSSPSLSPSSSVFPGNSHTSSRGAADAEALLYSTPTLSSVTQGIDAPACANVPTTKTPPAKKRPTTTETVQDSQRLQQAGNAHKGATAGTQTQTPSLISSIQSVAPSNPLDQTPRRSDQPGVKSETTTPHLLKTHKAPDKHASASAESEPLLVKQEQCADSNTLLSRPAESATAALQAGDAMQAPGGIGTASHTAITGREPLLDPKSVPSTRQASSVGRTATAQTDTNVSQSLPARPLVRPAAKEQSNIGSIEPSNDSDPWVNTPVTGTEESAYRRGVVAIDDRSARPTYDRFSPPRAATPPLRVIVSREWDHYSPSPDRSSIRRSPPYRKRPRAAKDDSWPAEDEPPQRRPKNAATDDYMHQRRVTASDMRAKRTRPPTPPYRQRSSSPPTQQYLPPIPYGNGYMAYAQPVDWSPPVDHYASGSRPTDPSYQPAPANIPGSSVNLFSRDSFHRAPDQGVIDQQHDADAELRSTLLARISDSQAGTSRQARARNSPPGATQRGRGTTTRGRGRAVPAKNGGRQQPQQQQQLQQQQRSLQSRLTGGADGLGARLS